MKASPRALIVVGVGLMFYEKRILLSEAMKRQLQEHAL